jgi:asparagine synthetase B (glutamine-hydrolysing)
MCGIAGIISKQTSKPEQRIKLCTDALTHRGPEDRRLLL